MLLLSLNKQNGRKKMAKLIQKFMADPTEKNLQKIVAYNKKHPFAWMMISKEEAEFMKGRL